MNAAPLRMLLVDGEESLRESLAKHLRDRYSYQVDAVARGEEALELVTRNKGQYDVAVIALMLEPGPDGIEVMQEIRSHYPNINCAIMTGWGRERRKQAREAGAFDYLEKPITVEELAITIHDATQQARLRPIRRATGNEPEKTQYYSCFISYSSQDQGCADRLHADLKSRGVRCWFAPEDMKTGDKILDRIDREIGVYDKLLLIFSEHSISSDWVETEVHAALEKERYTKRTVLFPIRLDDAVMETSQAWAIKVRRERHIADFRGWKDRDTYQREFARLLRDLQAVDAQEVSGVEPVPSIQPRHKPTETYRVKLRQNLVAAFNDSELRDLCFDMNVDYESLGGENKADKARELIAFCERRQSVPDLVAKCRELRPKVEWEGEYE